MNVDRDLAYKVEAVALKARQRGVNVADALAAEDLLLSPQRRWQIMADSLEAFAETCVWASVGQVAREVGDVVPRSPADTVKLMAAFAQLTAMKLREKT